MYGGPTVTSYVYTAVWMHVYSAWPELTQVSDHIFVKHVGEILDLAGTLKATIELIWVKSCIIAVQRFQVELNSYMREAAYLQNVE